MKPSIRCTIAVLIGAIIPVATLTHTAKNATAAAQTEPDYRSRTIYFLLTDRRSAVIHVEAISSIVLTN